MGSLALSNVVSQIRAQFPALDQEINGSPLVYLDNAATTQKPISVIEAEANFYRHDGANVHRGVHTLSQRATDQFEAVRNALASFIGAPDPSCVIWTKGCTEAINLVAASWGGSNLKQGDVVLLSGMEHHANIVPWQRIAEARGAKVHPIPINDAGELLLEELENLLVAHPARMVGVKHVCNALGTINPIREVARLAHRHGALVMVDGAQALAHQPVDVTELDVDFYAMSAHKAYGPTGLGALYGRRELLEAMPPYQSGGDMIRTVSWEGTTYNDLPNKFEPGSPHIAGVIAFGAALKFLRELDLQDPKSPVRQAEEEVVRFAMEELRRIGGVRLVGTSGAKTAVVSFIMDAAHPHDIGTILDSQGIAIRTGHHCCMPLMRRLGVPATARASFAAYSTLDDVERLVKGLKKVKEVMS